MGRGCRGAGGGAGEARVRRQGGKRGGAGLAASCNVPPTGGGVARRQHVRVAAGGANVGWVEVGVGHGVCGRGRQGATSACLAACRVPGERGAA